jgi:hypothetical protein
MKVPPGWQAPQFSLQMMRENQEEGRKWLVSAIILNWNTAKHTCECLESLSQQTYPGDRIEVIVVDNGSAEDTTPIQKALEQHQKNKGWKQAKIVYLPYNIGIPAGYNVGLRESSHGSHVLLRLDNDVILDSKFIQLGVETMRQMPDIAALGGSQWRKNHDVAGLPVYVRWWKLAHQYFSPYSEDKPIDCDTLPGCALLIRRDAIQDMRVVFDPELLAMHDETDLLIRLRAAGWRVCYLGTCRCIHDGGASTKRVPKFFQYVSARNITLLARRYAPFPDRFGSYFFIGLLLLQSIVKRNYSSTRGFIGGLIGNPWKPRITRPLPQQPEM